MAVDTVGANDQTTEYEGPVSSYQVFEAKPMASDTRFVASDLYGEEQQRSIDVVDQLRAAAAAKQQAPPPAAAVVKKPEHTSTKMVAALGVGLGVLSALAVVAFVLMPGKNADTKYDMGALTSTTTGLKGHLITNWGDRLDYKLTIEPSDPSQLDSFVTAISHPPEPLLVNLQLKDVSGKVLCDTPILLKYDPLSNIASTVVNPPATSNATSKTAKVDEAAQTQAQVDQALNNARLLGQELNREHGKDIFQPVKGNDGQISSIASQGTLPCNKKQYQSAASWAFVTNFPSILQPVGPDSSDAMDVFGVAPGTNDKSVSERKAGHKISFPNSHFSVDSDDALVGYQASTGVVETRNGKTFLVEKRELVASSLKGVDLPIPIHYRCDQLGACALAGLNSGIQRAWLER
jgi:hypothetical protein